MSVRVCVCVFVVYMSSLFSLDSVKVKVELPASVHYCGTLLCFLLFLKMSRADLKYQCQSGHIFMEHCGLE